MEQVEVLNECYTNLDYDNDKEEALKKIYNLSETIRFSNNVQFLKRIETLTDVIQENISLFQSVCRHVDVIDTILEYLNAFVMKYTSGLIMPELDQMAIFSIEIMTTLFNICKESAVKLFLLHPLFTDSLLDVEGIHSEIEYWLNSIDLEGEMIILQDSDLYAVINYLIITDNFPLCKIWVQEQVEEKFLWLVDMKGHHLQNLTVIHTFQSLKDIQFHVCHKPVMNMVSIWTEDIVAAKNFALSLNSHIVFINSHMDFFGVVATLPYCNVISHRILSRETLNKIRKKQSDSDVERGANLVHISDVPEMNLASIHNLFYDGTWQEPVKGMYWKHNGNLWANATDDDIIRCFDSAEKGFETWSVKSTKTRVQILSKLVSILELNGKHVLAAIVARWLKFPFLYICLAECLKNGNRMVETIRTTNNCIPAGVIILREENENVLFFRLMQTIIVGNSAIVMFDPNFCNLAQYCDMFSTCGISPGVINLLSHEDTSMLEDKLCSEKYTTYASKIFKKGNSTKTYIESFEKLITIKIIIFRLT